MQLARRACMAQLSTSQPRLCRRNYMLKRALTAAALALAALSSNAQTVLLSENFDDFGSLAGKGWGAQNVSPFQDASSTSWFQGDASIFGAYSGSGESYI